MKKMTLGLLCALVTTWGCAEDPVTDIPTLPVSSATTTTTQTFTKDANLHLNDNGTIYSYIWVSGAKNILRDLSLHTAIGHDWSSDLRVYLTSPAGTRIAVTTGNASGMADVFNGTWWTDLGAALVKDAVYVSGVAQPSLVPEGKFKKLEGEDPNGLWTLEVADITAPDAGNLYSWSLEIQSSDAIPDSYTRFQNSLANDVIPDNSFEFDDINVAGVSDPLCGIDVYVDIDHTTSGQLRILLEAPDGTHVTLASNLGGSFDNIFAGTWFSDKADETLLDTTFANNITKTSVVPEGGLTSFNHLSGNGTWRLYVYDTVAGGVNGNFNSWGLRLYLCP